MIKLPKSLAAWGSAEFTDIFKAETSLLKHDSLPLQQGLSYSSYVSNDKINTIINNKSETDNNLIIKAGIFYSGIIAGCSCSDDPTPLDTQNEYCEILFKIDKQTAETRISLISD